MPKVQRSPPPRASLTPVQKSSVDPPKDGSENVTLRDKQRCTQMKTNIEDIPLTPVDGGSTGVCETLQKTLRLMFNDFEARQESRLNAIENKITLIKLQNDTIKNTNNEIEKSISDVSARIEMVQSTISRLENERIQLSNQISNIEDKYELIVKNLNKTSIEVRNVPKVKGESKNDLYRYLLHLSDVLNTKVEYHHIRDIYRLPNKKQNENSSIIIELVNTHTKGNILDACKKFHKSGSSQLSASHLGLENNNTRIFISEYLTSKGRRLLYLSKRLKADKGYSFCWTSGGNVYLRKADSLPAILIKNEDQLVKLRNEP